MSSNPFSNPFAVNGGEPAATGSLPARAAVAPAPVAAVPTAPVISQPLAPPAPSVAYNQPAAAPRAPAPAAVPAAPRAVASNGPAGWTPHGGSAVVVGPGDTLQALSTRYGVPAMAILQANGLSTASQLTPGRTVVIPVFNAVGAPAQSVAAAPARPAPAPAATAARPQAQPQMRLVEGARPAPQAKAAPARPEARRPEPAKPQAQAQATARPAPAAARPAPAPAAPARAAARPEPVQAQPQRAELPKTVAAKPVEAPKPAPVQAQPQPQPNQRVAALGNPPIAPAPVPPAPAPAPQPQRPDPGQTAALPANPGSGLDFRWPARGRVISGFGNGGNEGINIAVPEGTPVRAAEGGTVAYAGNELKGYGNLVLIRHDNGYVSAYAHNGEISVKRGDKITRGQVIAKSGQSGNVNSPQLHFEIRKGSTPVDPMPYLSN